jgi:ABC-2 type transport system ATP-binding protein
MSGGQRAQLALTLAIAKKPELLILDEPIASLDPLARSEFLQSLAEFTAAHQVSVVLSSHLLADLERVCDYLIVLVASRVQIAGPVTELLACHRMITGASRDPASVPAGWQVISASRAGLQSMLLVRPGGPAHDSAWTAASQITLEDLVLAYMSRAAAAPGHEPALEAQP